jgi:TM2 domain-containing membrane protein YozV
MKKLFVLALFCSMLMSFGTFASTSKYRIDDSSVEAVFSASVLAITNLENAGDSVLALMPAGKASKDPIVAIVLNFFLGWAAIHRLYLGGTPLLILGYIITFGGIFFIVPLIDLIVLIVHYNDISKYVGNNKFFMWG